MGSRVRKEMPTKLTSLHRSGKPNPVRKARSVPLIGLYIVAAIPPTVRQGPRDWRSPRKWSVRRSGPTALLARHLDVLDRLWPLPEVRELEQRPSPTCERLRRFRPEWRRGRIGVHVTQACSITAASACSSASPREEQSSSGFPSVGNHLCIPRVLLPLELCLLPG